MQMARQLLIGGAWLFLLSLPVATCLPS